MTMMMKCMTALCLVATVASSSWTPQFLRGSSDVDTPYDDLLKCMWNGTTVAACHSLSCKWCHSAFADLCVTDEYAANLDGSVFKCEGVTPSSDDDATADDDAATTDDDAVPTPTPTTEVPTPTPTDDPDDVHPIDDDDPNHGANSDYMDRLMKCMKHKGGKADCKDKEVKCAWCDYQGGGMCFSHQAAKQVDGAYYQCQLDDGEDETMPLSVDLMMG